MTCIFNITKKESIYLKGIAIILVLLGHTDYLYSSGQWGVALFLMLSGYGLYQSYQKYKTNDFFLKKYMNVYVPYVLVIIIFVIKYIYDTSKISKKVVLFSLLGLDLNNTVDPTMWYISYIFIEYFFFYFSTLISKFFDKNKRNIVIVITNIIFGFLMIYISNLYFFWGSGAGTHLYSFSFAIGVLMSFLNSKKVNKDKRNNVFTIIGLIIFIFYICTYKGDFSRLIYCFYANLLPIFIIILFELKDYKLNKYVELIGKYSYDIYLWEWFFVTRRQEIFSILQLNILIDIVTFLTIIFISIKYREMIINPIIKKIDEVLEIKSE